MENKKVFTVYSLKNHCVKKNEDGSWKCKSFTGTIDKVVNKLDLYDRGYSIRINPDKPCILYGDLDHIPEERIFTKFLESIAYFYDVSTYDISYTSSDKNN